MEISTNAAPSGRSARALRERPEVTFNVAAVAGETIICPGVWTNSTSPDGSDGAGTIPSDGMVRGSMPISLIRVVPNL
ncbi:hypothetical protein D3C72_2222450 [compost metagenome]